MREAKQFIIAKIVEEAQREGKPLSDREYRLLNYSSEPEEATDADPADLAKDQDEFEKRIARLIKRATKRCRTDGSEEYARWCDAVRLVKKQDHYLVVMIDRAGLRPPWDLLRLCLTALGIVAGAGGVIAILQVFDIEPPSKAAMAFYIWAIMLPLALVYCLLRLAAGKKIDELTGKLLGRMFQHRKAS